MLSRKTQAASHRTFAATGYRSGLEVATARLLDKAQVRYLYEACRIPYDRPAVYIPDFALVDQAIILETKGYFDAADRTKILRVRLGHPHLDIRFLFSQADAPLVKGSRITYGSWCRKRGFLYAQGPEVPSDWLEHQP